jgi:hypothetical protein
MKSLKFVLPCALALFAAAPAIAAPVVTLRGRQFVCTYRADHDRLTGHGRDYIGHQRRAELRAANRCFDLPHGTRVAMDNVNDPHACIRPRGLAYCVWASSETDPHSEWMIPPNRYNAILPADRERARRRADQ